MTPLSKFRCAAINKGRIGQVHTCSCILSTPRRLHASQSAGFSTISASRPRAIPPVARQTPAMSHSASNLTYCYLLIRRIRRRRPLS